MLILVSGAASSFRWMFVPSLAPGLAGGIWLIVTGPPLLPHPALSRLMMTLLAVPAVAAAVLAAFTSQGFVLETRGEVRSGEVTVAMGVVLRAAHRVSAARGPGTADGPEAAVGR